MSSSILVLRFSSSSSLHCPSSHSSAPHPAAPCPLSPLPWPLLPFSPRHDAVAARPLLSPPVSIVGPATRPNEIEEVEDAAFGNKRDNSLKKLKVREGEDRHLLGRGVKGDPNPTQSIPAVTRCNRIHLCISPKGVVC
jgi:hypothetical protein